MLITSLFVEEWNWSMRQTTWTMRQPQVFAQASKREQQMVGVLNARELFFDDSRTRASIVVDSVLLPKILEISSDSALMKSLRHVVCGIAVLHFWILIIDCVNCLVFSDILLLSSRSYNIGESTRTVWSSY